MNREQITIEYFGTNLTVAGHYFFHLSGDSFMISDRAFSRTPFDPETINDKYDPNGTVVYMEAGGYSICSINGSPYDKRGGCKSVFFTDKKVSHTQWKELIYSIPIAKKIIEQMPFEVKW